MRPLDRLPTLKLKLGIVIVAAVIATLAINELGVALDVAPLPRWVAAVAVGLMMVQLLARGMTSPLREMAAAATAMAHGDYTRTVHATSRDEVGDLARAFGVMAAELAAVDAMRRDLVATVSHELRTPITAVQALLENIVDGVQAADPATLRTMLTQVERLGRLVQQLLDLSRLESGVMRLDVRPVELRQLLDRAADEARFHARLEGRDVRIEVLAGGISQVAADEERLHQVLANLLDNAVRHTPDGTTVTIAAARTPTGHEISVTDEGPGISPADAARVFERYYRSADGQPDGGTGLGLAIVRWIVDLHGGRVAVDPTRTRGCLVVVDLP